MKIKSGIGGTRRSKREWGCGKMEWKIIHKAVNDSIERSVEKIEKGSQKNKRERNVVKGSGR